MSPGKIKVTNTKQSKEDGMTQILSLACTLEYAVVTCIVACLAHLICGWALSLAEKQPGDPKDK